MEKCIKALNGVPIYYYENKALHKFCITLYVKAGILYENKEEIGITHVWEHMIFRNINRVLDDKMKQRLDITGAYFNGCTFKEFVEIKIVAATCHFKECADILTKVFEDIDITENDFNVEKKRIKSEIREDDEKKTIDYMGQKNVWKGTNLRKSIAGKKKIVDEISLDRIKEYAKEILIPENIFLYVTGAVDDGDIVFLTDKVGEYELNKANAYIDKRENIAPIPHNFLDRNDKIKIKKGDYCSIRYSFDYDMNDCTKTEVDLLYDILFDGECSKLHEELSEKTGYVYSYSSCIEQYKNIGTLYFSYDIDEKNLEKSIDIVIKLLKQLKEGITNELDYVKPTYVDNGDMDLDEPEKLNWVMAYEGHILEQNYSNIEDRKKAYKKVTASRIKEVANILFQRNNLVVSVKYNKNKPEEKEMQAIIAKL